MDRMIQAINNPATETIWIPSNFEWYVKYDSCCSGLYQDHFENPPVRQLNGEMVSAGNFELKRVKISILGQKSYGLNNI